MSARKLKITQTLRQLHATAAARQQVRVRGRVADRGDGYSGTLPQRVAENRNRRSQCPGNREPIKPTGVDAGADDATTGPRKANGRRPPL